MAGKLDLIEFTRFFKGNSKAYGVHIYDAPSKNGEKRNGKSFTKLEPLGEKQYSEHLSGKQGLGVIPINERNKCQFAVIDVDEYKIDFDKYFKINMDYSLPLCFFRSKSGGLHIYLFFDQEYLAEKVIVLMKKLLIVLGLKSDTEIFPKQAKLKKNGSGSWINLPYHNSDKPTQYLFDQDGKKVSLTHAMQHIKNNTVTVEELQDIISTIPFADAPPCLQTLYLLNDFTKDSHNRNDFLFNVAAYLKNKYDTDYQDKLLEVNEGFPHPVDRKRIEGTIFNSHDKKTWSYNCKHPILIPVCDKEVCKTREYGINSEESPNINYGDLIQYVGLAVRYEWQIGDKILKFNSEDEIINQETFLKLSIRELKEYPYRLSRKRWDRVVREAVSLMEVKEDKDEFSHEILFKDYLIKFLTEGAKARSKEQIGLHRVFEDKKLSCYIFRRIDLMDFLETKHFYKLRPKEIKEIIMKMGAREKRYHIKDEKYIRSWLLPIDSLDMRFTLEDRTDKEMLENFDDLQEEGTDAY